MSSAKVRDVWRSVLEGEFEGQKGDSGVEGETPNANGDQKTYEDNPFTI